MSTPACLQCGCPDEAHWPDHGQPTSACAECLAGQAYTERPGGGEGICTTPADEVRAASTPLTLTAVVDGFAL